ncbi:MAG: DEAD/DEAH box helicase [Anaerolineae bacterium]|nr:DEAD/DEAH box helicase [Phycisphaerae bacterium]
MNFADLRLAEPILRSLKHEGYENPTPIQAQAIPDILAGRDLLGCAQTGTGKTAAFALPILHRLTEKPKAVAVSAPHAAQGHHGPGHPVQHVPVQPPVHQPHRSSRAVRCLVLAPTRELALQIDESFRTYGRHLGLKHAVVFGGVNQHGQVSALSKGVDILVATPGRLLDLMNQGYVNLTAVEVFVLDEADRMLDMGFIHDIRQIVAKLPRHRQNLMFSATMPPDIRALADTILNRPAQIQVTPAATTLDAVDQSVYFVDRRNKPALLAHLIKHSAISRALVFTRTKHGADRVVRQLYKSGIRAEAIHGNKTQNARQRALTNFKNGKTPILIASDIAARGIDVDDISHVFNYDVTHEPETYVHRIGRTARAGAKGHAISFCDAEERQNLKAIERLIRKTIRVADDQPVYAAHTPESKAAHDDDRERQPQSHQRGGGGEHRDGQHRSGGGHRSGNDRQQPNSHRNGSHRSSSRSQPHSRSQSHSQPQPQSQSRSRDGNRAATPALDTARDRQEGSGVRKSGGHPSSHRAKHPLDRRAQGGGGQHGHRKQHAKHR